MHQGTQTNFTDSKGRKLRIRFEELFNLPHDYKFVVSDGADTASIKIDGFTEELKYAFVDAIPNGNKELVILNTYYIMNGYNFDLLIFELITR